MKVASCNGATVKVNSEGCPYTFGGTVCIPKAASRKDDNVTIYGYLILICRSVHDVMVKKKADGTALIRDVMLWHFKIKKIPRSFSMSFLAQGDVVIQKSGLFAYSHLVSSHELLHVIVSPRCCESPVMNE